MKPSTHYFKESVLKDGVRYQHVIGLNEEYDWRLILDLSEDPSWQFITVKKPPICRFPDRRRGLAKLTKLLEKRTVYRCPKCRTRLYDCEARYPDGSAHVFLLPSRPSSFELWHDDDAHCPCCHARLGINLPSAPALPAPKRAGLFGKRPAAER